MVLGIVRHISSLSLTCFSRQGTVRCVLACRASIPHSPRQLCRTMLHAYGCIRSELTTLIDDEGENVVVAMHSCGGIVGTEAVDAAWNKQSRQAKGQPGGVLRLLYLCAFVLPPNASLASGFGGQIPPLIETQADGFCRMKDPGHRFYNDLDEKARAHWVSELRPTPTVTQTTPLTYVAYMHHPVSYLFCTNDAALDVEIQKMMVARLEKNGIEVHTETCSSGHSPFPSMPEQVLELVNRMLT